MDFLNAKPTRTMKYVRKLLTEPRVCIVSWLLKIPGLMPTQWHTIMNTYNSVLAQVMQNIYLLQLSDKKEKACC